LRDAELMARAVIDGFDSRSLLNHALEQYETTRDELSVPLFDVVDRIAGHRWNEHEIGQLLLELNSATAAEVEMLAAIESGAMS
jgi:hypothetical protein